MLRIDCARVHAHARFSLADPRSYVRPEPLAIFELDGIRLARDGRPVLRDVTLSIPSGATAVLGPSGCGKSTLLRLLNRLADPDEGTVRFHGTDVRELDPLELRRRVGLVPQLPAPVPGTVADNVCFGPRLEGGEVDPVRPVRLAGLDESFLDRDASRLSVGEQQRVMLARALALEPEVLLLDEPTASLDSDAKVAVEEALRSLTGVSLVLVTHDPAQAERLAERTIRLSEGRVAA
jgi:putative ABC transport system ATP-binding protein